MEPVSTARTPRECCVPLLQQQRGPAVGKGTDRKQSTPGGTGVEVPRGRSPHCSCAPGPPGPATLVVPLSPVRCSWRQGLAGHAGPAGIAAAGSTTWRPELFSAGQLTQSPLSVSELGALASLVNSLLSNKLADSTSGHLYLRAQAQNFLRGQAR